MEDYTPLSGVELTFEQGATERCINLQLAADNVLEDDENFQLILTSSDDAVITNPDTTVVTINNDDSKLVIFFNS